MKPFTPTKLTNPPLWAACSHGLRNRRVCVECFQQLQSEAAGKVAVQVDLRGRVSTLEYHDEVAEIGTDAFLVEGRIQKYVDTARDTHDSGYGLTRWAAGEPSHPSVIAEEERKNREASAAIERDFSAFHRAVMEVEPPTAEQIASVLRPVFANTATEFSYPAAIDRRDHEWKARVRPLTHLNLMTPQEYADAQGGWRQ